MRRYLEVLFYVAMLSATTIGVLAGRHLAAQETQKDPLATCSLELERLRAYATILKGDRDQKEAALAGYSQQVQTLTAELAKLKEKP